MGLVEKSCVPCQGGHVPIPRAEAEVLMAQVEGWHLNDGATSITRRFKFKDFAEAFRFAERVGNLAEREGHHPVLLIGWGFCQVEFMTHKIKGLHENDFVMAAKVNDLLPRV